MSNQSPAHYLHLEHSQFALFWHSFRRNMAARLLLRSGFRAAAACRAARVPVPTRSMAAGGENRSDREGAHRGKRVVGTRSLLSAEHFLLLPPRPSCPLKVFNTLKYSIESRHKVWSQTCQSLCIHTSISVFVGHSYPI
uniref:Uncharacterized protein n=1 Tax=Oryzias sinensis TaxID=183150 RepID=A0A8C7WYR7_9TELE